MHYGVTAPALWFMIPEAEREKRCGFSSKFALHGQK
jgi:hypothetical protein